MIQSFSSMSGLFDAVLVKAIGGARAVSRVRSERAQDPSLHFDALPAASRAQLLTAVMLADQIEHFVPSRVRADAVAWRESSFKRGEPVGVANYLQRNVRADASAAAGSGLSDIDGVFTLSQVFDKLVAPLTIGNMIPVDGKTPLGALSVRHRRKYNIGSHLPIAASGGAMGTAGFSIESGTTDIHWYGTEASIWQMQIEDGNFAGLDFQGMTETSAREAAERKQDDIGWTGDSSTNLYGVLNFPATSTVIGGTLDVSDPESIAAAIKNQVVDISRQSGGAMKVNKIAVSYRIFGALVTDRPSVAQTAMASLLAMLKALNGGSDVSIQVDRHLDASGPGGQDGILYLDDSKGADGLHQIALGPLVFPVVLGPQIKIYYITKQGGVSQPSEHAARIAWHAITGD